MIQQEKDLQAIFKSFDSDSSGAIELSELKNISIALGKQISEDRLHKIMTKLDANKDGKISFQEFRYWWQNGHTGDLGDLVFLRAKSLKLSKKYLTRLQQVGIKLQELQTSNEINKLSMDFTFGKIQNQGVNIKLNIHHKGPKSKEKISELSTKLGVLNNKSAHIIIELPCSNPQQAKIRLMELLVQIFKHPMMPLKIENLEDNNLLKIKIINGDHRIFLHLQVLDHLLNLFEEPLLKMQQIDQILGQDIYVSIEAQFKTNFDVLQLLQQQNIIQTLLKGFAMRFKLEIPNSMLKKIRQISQAMLKGDISQSERFPMLFSLLAKNTSFKMKFKSPEMISNFFDKLGISSLLKACPCLEDILEQVGMIPETTQLKINLQDPKHYLYKFLSFMNKNIQSGIEFYLYKDQSIAHVATSLMNSSKIFKIIFNQL